jgi:hypothetical protein
LWSIYRIRKLTKEKEIEINTKIMILHAATFSIYVLSSIMIIVELKIFEGFSTYEKTSFLSVFCERLTELMICYIFWNIEKIKFVPVPTFSQTADEEIAQADAIKLELVLSNDSEF